MIIGAAATPAAAFDAAGFVSELVAIGCRPYAFRSVSMGGVIGPWRYGIGAPKRGFGRDFSELMARWDAVIDVHPDHVDRVAAYIVEKGRRT